MQKLKVVSIGGGSSYTPELIDGFLKRYDTFPVTEIWLVDIEAGQKKLAIVSELAKRMIKKAGLPIQLYTTLDRREALKGADYVVTQIRVGLLDARIKDEEISLRHGIIGQETNGAGGLFKALRTVPVILDIVKDIQELCPNAWLINFSNPAGMITEAIFRYTSFRKVVGLCNVPLHMQFQMADVLGVDYNRLRLEWQGLNHHGFVTKIFLDEKDVTHELIEKFLGYQNMETMKNIPEIPFEPELIRGLQAIPNDYLNYYVNTQEQLASQLKQLAESGTRARVVQKVEADLFKLYQDEHLDEKPKELDLRGGAHYSDAACNLINSLHNDLNDIQYVNTQNQGACSNMEKEMVLECACRITKDGPIPLSIGKIDYRLLGTIANIKAFELMAIEAAVTGNRDLTIAALSMNPLCPSGKTAVAVVDDLLAAHREYLPRFFKD